MSNSPNALYGADSQPRPETTTDDVLSGMDLSGQTVLVTGGTSGLGRETARVMATHNADVIITARTAEKGQAVCDELRAETGSDRISFGVLELGSLSSVRQFAEDFLSKHPKLNILINNAGVMACPHEKTEDGFELQFGSNHIGHFALAEQLVPALKNGAPSRVVSLSSRGHIFAGIDFEDPNFETRPYHKWVSYGQAKTANALFAVEFNRRYAAEGIEAFAVHPGVIMTDLMRHMDDADFELLNLRNTDDAPTTPSKTIPQGAATSVWAATAPELSGKGGAYLEDCSIATLNDDPNAPGGVRSHAIDEEDGKRLWDLSVQLVARAS